MRRMVTGKKAAGLLVFLLCLSAAALAYGSWMARADADNILTMSSYKARVVEEYDVPKHVDPSEKIKKRVEVKNEGTVPILVRVSVKKVFGDRGADGVFREDPSLDTDVIEIHFHDTFWEERGGWFYYKEVLGAQETTREPLMDSYTLSRKAGNEYKGKEAQIIVTMESVQAEGGAEAVWGNDARGLGTRWAQMPEAHDTGVAFLGKQQGFSYTMDGTDLFASFKNLLPGCARSQKITVENRSSESVEIFLRAEETGQVSMSEEQRELVGQLLTRYAVIEVAEGDRVVYRGAVCGQDETGSMRSDISLGEFAAGSEKELSVKLSLSPEMDNRYQKLTAKVRWVFSAHGEDGTVVQGTAPATGDESRAGLWAVLSAAGAAALWESWRFRKKNRRTAA